jgi:hypothetical protein
VLPSAELVQPGREPERMDGNVVVERDRIDGAQTAAPTSPGAPAVGTACPNGGRWGATV